MSSELSSDASPASPISECNPTKQYWQLYCTNCMPNILHILGTGQLPGKFIPTEMSLATSSLICKLFDGSYKNSHIYAEEDSVE